MPQTVVTSAPARPVGVSVGKAVGSVASALLGRSSIGKKFARPLGVRPNGKMAGKHVATKAAASGGIKKRHKPGKRALKEVKKYQNSVELELRKLPFQRCVREVVAELNTNQYDLKMQHEGIHYLQECTELYIAGLFDGGWRAAKHRERKTLFPKDVRSLCATCARSSRNDRNPGPTLWHNAAPLWTQRTIQLTACIACA